jgi:hypothetical protein
MGSIMRAHVIVDTHTGEISVEGYEAHHLRPDCADCRAALARGEHPLMLVPPDLDEAAVSGPDPSDNNDEVTLRDVPIDDDLAQLLRDELEERSVRQRPRWRAGGRRR